MPSPQELRSPIGKHYGVVIVDGISETNLVSPLSQLTVHLSSYAAKNSYIRIDLHPVRPNILLSEPRYILRLARHPVLYHKVTMLTLMTLAILGFNLPLIVTQTCTTDDVPGYTGTCNQVESDGTYPCSTFFSSIGMSGCDETVRFLFLASDNLEDVCCFSIDCQAPDGGSGNLEAGVCWPVDDPTNCDVNGDGLDTTYTGPGSCPAGIPWGRLGCCVGFGS
jgi:hypothetical protein